MNFSYFLQFAHNTNHWLLWLVSYHPSKVLLLILAMSRSEQKFVIIHRLCCYPLLWVFFDRRKQLRNTSVDGVVFWPNTYQLWFGSWQKQPNHIHQVWLGGLGRWALPQCFLKVLFLLIAVPRGGDSPKFTHYARPKNTFKEVFVERWSCTVKFINKGLFCTYAYNASEKGVNPALAKVICVQLTEWKGYGRWIRPNSVRGSGLVAGPSMVDFLSGESPPPWVAVSLACLWPN